MVAFSIGHVLAGKAAGLLEVTSSGSTVGDAILILLGVRSMAIGSKELRPRVGMQRQPGANVDIH